MLLEIFQKVLNYEQTSYYDTKRYVFKTPENNLYAINFFETDSDDSYEVIFVQRNDGNIRVSITNTGESFIVFSTIIAIIEEFIQKYKPNKLKFSAKTNEPSRLKLYKALLNKFANQYKINQKHSDDNDYFEINFKEPK